MHTFETNLLTPEQLDEFDRIAGTTQDPELHELLMSLSNCLRDGDDLIAVHGGETMTPAQVADRLGMSRTHLYKLLDRGELPSHRVGRDRRIQIRDLVEFEQQRQRDRRELAERFAHQQSTAAAADDAIAELL